MVIFGQVVTDASQLFLIRPTLAVTGIAIFNALMLQSCDLLHATGIKVGDPKFVYETECLSESGLSVAEANTYAEPQGIARKARESGRVLQVHSIVFDVTVKVDSALESQKVLAREASSARVVVSGAVVVQARFSVRFAGRVLERIGE